MPTLSQTALLVAWAGIAACHPHDATVTSSDDAVPAAASTPAGPAEPTAAEQTVDDPTRAPVIDASIAAAREAAQRQVLPRGAEPQPDPRPLPDGPLPGAALQADPLPGFFTALEIPEGPHPLASFEAALAELEAGTREQPVRIAVYGASSTVADVWTAYLRRYLQTRFGDGGPGIVSAAPHNRWYRHYELEVEASKHWTKHNTYTVEDDDPGWFGPMGVAHSARSKRAWAKIGPSRWWPDGRRIAHYELLYVEQHRGGTFTVRIDDEVVAKVSTRLPKKESEPRLGIRRLELDPDTQTEPPVLRIDVKGNGEVRMLGVIAETGEPGVVVDTLGVDGAKISNQLAWHEDLWAKGLQHRAPELFVLAFGNNASMDEDVPIGIFESGYRTVLQRLRTTVPDASCVLLGPGDFPKVAADETLAPRPRLDEIREIERRLAAEHGCAFWDGLKFEGGPGAKQAWVDAGLSRDDYLHLTRAGYVRLGLAFGDALMHHYDFTRLRRDGSD